MNDIIWRAMKRAQIHAVKEPVGLMRQDGASAQMAPPSYPGPEASHWRGTSQYRTHIQTHMWPTQPDRQALQPLTQQTTRRPSTAS